MTKILGKVFEVEAIKGPVSAPLLKHSFAFSILVSGMRQLLIPEWCSGRRNKACCCMRLGGKVSSETAFHRSDED